MNILKKVIKYGYEFLIDHVIAPVFILFPCKKAILLESVPSMGDSTFEVYRELIKRKINDTYKIIWWLYDDCETEATKNVYYIKRGDSRLKLRYYEYTSKCIISCNRFLSAHSKKQTAFYIAHGSPLKRVDEYYYLPKGIDCFFCASEGFRQLLAEQLHAAPQKGIATGLPRNDILGTTVQRPAGYYFEKPECKTIIWYPTFRQHKTGVSTAAKHVFPIIHDKEAVMQLDNWLKAHHTIIVIKPHFAQDMSSFKMQTCSNIFLIDDQFFKTNAISSYEFVNSGDALLSDYSSIYYDYLLCDKPVGLVWEDINEYREKPGFAVDIDRLCAGGEKIYTLSDLFGFVERVSLGIDELKEERNKIKLYVNHSDDHQNTKRVTEIILKSMGLSM